MKSSETSPAATLASYQTDALEEMLSKPMTPSVTVPTQAKGIITGHFEGLDEDGTPTVSIDAWGLRNLKAGTLVTLDASQLGECVALGFEAADPTRPIILGFMLSTEASTKIQSAEARLDQKRVVLHAEQEIELRCGEAAIILTADGRVTIRGTYVTSQASATQRILGGSVNLN
jgi:hypothetical protein